MRALVPAAVASVLAATFQAQMGVLHSVLQNNHERLSYGIEIRGENVVYARS